MAAGIADTFGNLAFVQKNADEAYGYLSDGFRKAYSLEAFKGQINKLHQDSFPSDISSTEYEPVPGQEQMNIFLEGHNGSQTFYYRFLMLGNSDSGYKVGGFWRNNNPYPPSELRLPLH